ALGALLLFIAMAAPALAVDSIWNGLVSGTGDWNTNNNWTPATAPVKAGDTATFNFSSLPLQTLLSLSSGVTINSMTFNSGASAFTINTNGNSLSFVGVGIVNRSVNTQTISNDFGGTTSFLKNSTAANATIINSNSGTGGAGMTNFSNGSTAGNATITNGGPFGGGGSTTFNNSSNAGNATITNNGGIVSLDPGGSTTFKDTSKAGNATLIANGGPF